MRSNLGAVLLLATIGCGQPRPAPPIGSLRPPTAALATSLFLIGDAGAPADGDRVLRHLETTVREAAADTVVVYLGDNIYPDGLPPAGTRGYAEAERRLLLQVEAARPADRVVFIAGNHDWNQTGTADDWDAVMRQDQRLRKEGLALSPSAGCPGPEVIDIGAHLRLVAIDTEWWLHGFPSPRRDNCESRTPETVLDAVEAAVREPEGRHVVVLGHHPPVSAGPHGGYFDWQDHVFPLREIAPWLWVPLPVVGSAYPLVRRTGVTAQDQSHPAHRHMVAALKARLAPYTPLLYAAGHEHQLNLLTGASIGARYVAVSGAGMTGHERDAIGRPDGLIFAARTPGFMRLDVFTDATVRLQIITIPSDTRSRIVYETWVQ